MFFFFKQKTAYEMRISDWSSDVCSSDLEAMRNYLARLGWSHGDDEIFSTEQAMEWFGLDSIGRSPSRFDFVKLESLNGHYIREIGRASCRERVCQYGVDLGGRRIIKKKT